MVMTTKNVGANAAAKKVKAGMKPEPFPMCRPVKYLFGLLTSGVACVLVCATIEHCCSEVAAVERQQSSNFSRETMAGMLMAMKVTRSAKGEVRARRPTMANFQPLYPPYR